MALKNSIYNNLINSYDLKKIIKNKNIKVIDCRWFLNNQKKGYKEYLKNHIPSAIFFDIELISNPKIDLPHMMPTENLFNNFVNKNGINRNNKIIIYDQNGFFSSTRVWFTFKCFGFNKVNILNGGFQAWKKNNYKLSSIRVKSKYCCTLINKNLNEHIINKNEIQKSIKSNDNIIIDARPTHRFLGKVDEPRPNTRKGNIIKSVNIPFNKICDISGKLKKFYDLKKIFKSIKKNKKIICYCGSGVTACNLIFVLNLLNFANIKLYDGSWAEWGKIK